MHRSTYSRLRDVEQEESTVSWKKFFIFLAGNTQGAHVTIVEKLKSSGQTEVQSPERSDYLLLFCPVASRVGTDISEALETVPDGKPIILVVMHHTFNPNCVVAESRRQVNNQNVRLTVDYLFHEGNLLTCSRNDIALFEIERFLGVSGSEISQSNLSWKKFFVILAGNTQGAHVTIVEKLKSSGQTEVDSAEKSDYRLLFCPVASRVGTDISEALQTVPDGKPIILVVMHHTFNPNCVVAESRRQVNNQNVRLTVDYLFHEGKLLTCSRNDIALFEIEKLLGVSGSEISQSNLSWKKFFVILAGNTQGAHVTIVEKLKSSGQTEVDSAEKSDYRLLFCPVASRVGTDISEALQTVPDGKPIILVVMHHTFNPNCVVAESRRQVNNQNVRLTVDYLFHEGNLLTCSRNDIALFEIEKLLGVSGSEISQSNLSWKKFFVILAGNTQGAHVTIVEKLKSSGQTEVDSAEKSDYRLLFCPVASRVGTDISEALQTVPDGKPIILVVMHHTFNPNCVVAESRRQVNNQNVRLTVDYLFHEGKLLTCSRNDHAWSEIKKLLGVSGSEVGGTVICCLQLLYLEEWWCW
ncbi:uncharacterized protein LOC143335860 isoform X2 [Chaetodon auriga]|uniref:uncharacterized protein LOC143335860 isoform X2 n=1 Tax=Chaetodon auriga TaxID=39042 RepID=UPI004032C504